MHSQGAPLRLVLAVIGLLLSIGVMVAAAAAAALGVVLLTFYVLYVLVSELPFVHRSMRVRRH